MSWYYSPHLTHAVAQYTNVAWLSMGFKFTVIGSNLSSTRLVSSRSTALFYGLSTIMKPMGLVNVEAHGWMTVHAESYTRVLKYARLTLLHWQKADVNLISTTPWQIVWPLKWLKSLPRSRSNPSSWNQQLVESIAIYSNTFWRRYLAKKTRWHWQRYSLFTKPAQITLTTTMRV